MRARPGPERAWSCRPEDGRGNADPHCFDRTTDILDARRVRREAVRLREHEHPLRRDHDRGVEPVVFVAEREQLGAVDPWLWPTVCSAEEHAWLLSQPTEQRPELATKFLCAKEAFYKCQYAVTGSMAGFP